MLARARRGRLRRRTEIDRGERGSTRDSLPGRSPCPDTRSLCCSWEPLSLSPARRTSPADRAVQGAAQRAAAALRLAELLALIPARAAARRRAAAQVLRRAGRV